MKPKRVRSYSYVSEYPAQTERFSLYGVFKGKTGCDFDRHANLKYRWQK